MSNVFVVEYLQQKYHWRNSGKFPNGDRGCSRKKDWPLGGANREIIEQLEFTRRPLRRGIRLQFIFNRRGLRLIARAAKWRGPLSAASMARLILPVNYSLRLSAPVDFFVSSIMAILIFLGAYVRDTVERNEQRGMDTRSRTSISPRIFVYSCHRRVEDTLVKWLTLGSEPEMVSILLQRDDQNFENTLESRVGIGVPIKGGDLCNLLEIT